LGKLVVISGSKSDIHIINIYARAREEFIPYIGGVSFTHVRRPTPSEHRTKNNHFVADRWRQEKYVFCPKKGKKDGCGKVL